MLRDLRLAGRGLLRRPGFTCLAVVILALGLGATTAMFSLVNAVALRPLPFPRPEALVRVQVGQGPEQTGYYFLPPFVFRHLRAHNDVFEGMAAVAEGSQALVERGHSVISQAVTSLAVTADFFALLGVAPALGRVFLPEEDEPGGNRVVVLSARLWRDRFGADPGILGRSLQLNDQTVTVVGVMPPGFSDPLRRWTRVDLWRPMRLPPAAMAPGYARSLEVWARLKPGVQKAAATAHLTALVARLQDGQQRAVRLKPLGEKSGLEDESEAAIWFTMALAVFVLLIACTNLAGVQLARLAGRHQEQAIRVALGASRGRLIREALAESLLVSLAGGGLGLLLARWGTDLVSGRLILSKGQQTVGIPVELDARVLTFALATVLVSALIVGTAPVWLNARGALFDVLRKGGRTTTDRGRPRLRQGLVVAEMAMALVLLMGGGLFLRGLQRLEGADPGWQPAGVMTARVTISGTRYAEPGARVAFLDRLQQRLAGLPGVAGSALANSLPVVGGERLRFAVEGMPATVGSRGTFVHAVSPGYFATLGIPMREGRELAASDGPDGQPVAVINESMARDLWPGSSPIGKRLSFAGDDPSAPASYKSWKTVVGVVGDVRFTGYLEDPRSRYQAYFPTAQALPSSLRVALRTQGSPEALAGALRQAVAELDPRLLVDEVASARSLTDTELANFSLFSWVMLGFAGLGLLLSALGVYGLFSGFVAEHTREIGVRMALGAHRRQVLAMVLRKGLRLAGAGALVGMLGVAAVVPVLRAVAYGLPAHEPLAVAALALMLVIVALFACWLPARRAAALDPMVALRQD